MIQSHIVPEALLSDYKTSRQIQRHETNQSHDNGVFNSLNSNSIISPKNNSVLDNKIHHGRRNLKPIKIETLQLNLPKDYI